MRRKTRWRLTYGLGLLLKCAEMAFAQCNGTTQQINTNEPLQGYITSPGFPKSYAPDLRCVYKLSAPLNAGLVIQFNVVELDLLGSHSSSSQCLRDYLLFVIIDRSGKEHVSQRYCGRLESLPLPVLNTLQSNAEIVFISSDASMRKFRGFRLHYSFVREVDIRAPISLYNDPNDKYRRECGGSTEPNEISGEINSPGFPYTYPKNVTCNWLVRVPEGKRIYLRLIHLQLSTTFAECSRASLLIIDGFKHESSNELQLNNLNGEIVRFCGSHSYYKEEGMKSYLSISNRVILRFITTDYPSSEQQTDRKENGNSIGFKIIWTEVNSLKVPDEARDIDCGSGFTCKGGEFCIDNGQNICAERMRLCINETLKCNGISNCAENDNSDEEFCYPEEFLIYVCILIVALLMLCMIGCLVHCLAKLCRSNDNLPSPTNHKKISNSHSHHSRSNKSSRQELLGHKNSIPRQSITVVNSTKQRNSRHSRQSDLLSLNPTGNDLPVWQLDSHNASSFIRFNNLQRAQV